MCQWCSGVRLVSTHTHTATPPPINHTLVWCVERVWLMESTKHMDLFMPTSLTPFTAVISVTPACIFHYQRLLLLAQRTLKKVIVFVCVRVCVNVVPQWYPFPGQLAKAILQE